MPDFEHLVDQVYEAAADPELWPPVLHDLARAADAAGGIILTRRADAWLGWRYSAAMEPGAEAYLSGAAARSQSTARLLAANRAGFVADQHLFTEEEYLADPLMTEWRPRPPVSITGRPRPSMCRRGTLLWCRLAGGSASRSLTARTFTACLDAFRPHLARAGLLAARWRLERLQTAAEALALIGLPAAVLDARGKVLAANALIQAMQSQILWLPNDRIALTDPGANALLRQSIADIANPAASTVRSFPARSMARR
jgi:hypothetical protein